MANNDRDNPRRDPNRPEDNPFIAFRRFADSQVSSLLNSVFTLPATIANYNNAHQAREQCLFGKADKRQCDKLHEIESEITDLRHEGRERFRSGDMQAVLKNSEQMMRLDQRADDLRRNIVDQAEGRNRGNIERHNEKALVERVANEKGQEWGWSWDWGFPRPFDHEGKAPQMTAEDQAAQQAREYELMLQLQSEVKKLVFENMYDEDDAHAELSERAWQEEGVRNQEQLSGSDERKPRVWSWSRSWQWPPPADSSQSEDTAYSPRVLDQDPEMKSAGVQWEKAYEDLLRAERNERPHCMRSEEPVQHHRRCRRGPFRHADEERSRDVFTQNQSKWASQEAMEGNDEPSYEYAHDHEDQHDDPPTPKVDRGGGFSAFHKAEEDEGTSVQEKYETQKFLDPPGKTVQGQFVQQEPPTELDAYEQLLGAKQHPFSSSSARANNETANPSILSTLTTTERTVSPDGLVTTKVVLKKRFADGREESSETVHTQSGQESNARPFEPWKPAQDAQASSIEKDSSKKEGGKRSGWFWSS
ncbi:hypothetical protein N0V83_000306 [Neocucurbitaria cava]|uniref:Uncharacterized protein n=1 Tax=Neocucurbitaria cava TaxID=798079 RepID=A0A9W9CR17_9PLEO|nr:hypothetical protein N0V83_000306 [Neocucurbitaria cava]